MTLYGYSVEVSYDEGKTWNTEIRYYASSSLDKVVDREDVLNKRRNMQSINTIKHQ